MQGTLPSWLVVHVGLDANKRSAIGTNVVLVGSELATFGSDTLQLLLTRSIGIADVHDHSLFADGDAVELLDDSVADVSRLEAGDVVSARSQSIRDESKLTERSQRHGCCPCCHEGFWRT